MQEYKVEYLDIVDAVFTMDKKRVLEFCDMVNKKGIDISWSCYSHITTLDQEILKSMKRGGCNYLHIGIIIFKFLFPFRVVNIIRKKK